MEKSKRKNGDMPIRIFKYSRVFQIIGLFVIALMSLATLGYFLNTNDPKWMLMLFLFGTGYLAFAFLVGLSESITIYKDGIEYQLSNRYIFVEWHQLSHFESHKYRRKIEQGIKTHSSVSQEKVDNFVDDQIYRKPYDDFIPLCNIIDVPIEPKKNGIPTIDLEKLKETEFGSLVNEYAPHLFEGEGL